MILNNNNRDSVYASRDDGVQFVMRRASNLIKRSEISGPPFPPERLAPLQKIKRIIREDLGNLSGLLLPLDGGFEIKINATHSHQRQNFTCAHEIAHTFFFEEEGRKLKVKMRGGNQDKRTKNWEEELCDFAASELLMPKQVFFKHASPYHFYINSVMPLSRKFNTSITPTILRLCDVNPKYCFIVRWIRDNSNELDDLKLRATWLTWSRRRISAKVGRFFYKPKIFGEHHSILKAYKSDSHTYVRQWMGVGNFRGYCQIWSQAFGTGAQRFVISLIYPECDKEAFSVPNVMQ